MQKTETQLFSGTFLRVMFYLPFLLVWAGYTNLQTPVISGIEAKFITAALFFVAAVCWVTYALHEWFTQYKPKNFHW